MDCGGVQAALHRAEIDPMVEAHLESCIACADERRTAMAVRSALVVEAPPELEARLLALVAPAAAPSRLDIALEQALVVPAPPGLSDRLQQLVPGAVPVQPARRPWVMPVYAATALLLGVLLVFAGQAYGLALQELGIGELWREVAELPRMWLDQFYAFFPQGQYVVGAFLSLQRALQWVLVGLLMWAVLEMRTPRRARSVA